LKNREQEEELQVLSLILANLAGPQKNIIEVILVYRFSSKNVIIFFLFVDGGVQNDDAPGNH
jgi:hypothetical protein